MPDDVFHPRSFDHVGQHFEIRVERDAQGVCVRAFKGDRPASVLSYRVNWETGVDFGGIAPAVEELIEVVKNDIGRGHGPL